MTVEDLKGTKIYLSNEEDRVKFQEKVFSLGVEWRGGASHEIVPDLPFYYISYNYKLTRDCATSSNFFISHPYKKIFLADVLEIEEPKKEYEFKPFDKVLVRDNTSDRWLPRLYSNRDRACKDYPYEITSGAAYRYCIPYEGNEHLAGTTNSK